MKMVMGWQENSMRWVRPPPRLWVHVSDAVVKEVRSMPHWFVSDTRFQHHGQLSLSLSLAFLSLSLTPPTRREGRIVQRKMAGGCGVFCCRWWWWCFPDKFQEEGYTVVMLPSPPPSNFLRCSTSIWRKHRMRVRPRLS